MKSKIILIFLISSILFSQNIVVRDNNISSMIEQISSKNLELYVKKLVEFKTRHTLSTRTKTNEGIGAACYWVMSKFDEFAKSSNGRLITKMDSFYVEPDGRRVIRKVLLTNPMAILKGTDKNDNRIFIVGAHIDSRAGEANDSTSLAPGANDDASGVAAVIELARIMSKYEFPSTIIFVAFSGEEQGLYGATHLAKKAKDENWNIIAMLNNDMIGNSYSNETFLKDNMQVRVFSEGIPLFETEEMKILRQQTNQENDSKSRQLARYIKEIGERYVDQIEVKLVYRNDRFLRGGDHTPFNRLGFTAIRFCEMNENYDHQHQNIREEKGIKFGDLPEFVDFEYARKITAINLATLANLALSPYQPKNVGIEVKEVTNLTTIKWETPENKKPKGYYVLMRETYQPFWQKKIYTEKTEITLPYSKDNYFFSVQSVDEFGHESLPVWPKPIR
ncbi:MAG: M20/M25/M40 family metallo-hydrolase [Melioribacteraceae bacterium]|nr:M20/M25/M40 family metallo-hydrolase [Melioribacteraceae bacterium]